ncbi:MAG TPA: aminotransferase class I/II-fold pyridoxal phosphate-dependent enzyme, partial [Thermoanaerobaculia bacterium]|nr:aminotransferase class I/II-fold pyridoxal phosphate-dependent enzyme [Thermoanaerobaculia bacterium]
MPEPQHHPLELTADEMRSLVGAALDRIVAHIESLPRQRVSDTSGGDELARSLAWEPLPEEGVPLSGLLDLLFDQAVPPSFNTASPGYLAYIPGGGLFHAAVADLIAEATNRYTSVYAAAPALAQIEANVIAWFCRIAGYPAEARGTLTSGGSLANLAGLITARRERLPENFLSGMIYTSDQAHYSVAKGAILAGFPEANVRSIPTDDRYRIRPDALEARIEEDRRQGLTPFLIAASAGTTNTGAVDPLPELADLAERHNLWLHVDAAYGGFFLLTEEGRRTLRGIERA